MSFSHLHVHTQYSLLDGAAGISKLYKKAIADTQPAMAITDHGNMFGVFNFVAEAYKHKHEDGTLKVKPIVGCEFYLVEDRMVKQFTKENKDLRYHQLFLAKNQTGYKNLSRLCSLGYMEGLYGKYPRIDKRLVEQYHEGLIATTCCLGASVPKTILRKGEEAGEKEFRWWLDLFGEDYYIELQRHDIPDQNQVNELLLKWGVKYGVKVICSNDSHYVDQADANAHDLLLCINTGDVQSTPKATDEEGGKGFRFGFPNDQFYFKTKGEMAERFADIPFALANTAEIVEKVDLLNLNRDILVPAFPIPEGFTDADAYLRHLTYEGARSRYQEITPEITERLDFELLTIKTMGFPGYFLIVADFVKAGRDMGVLIGPGRGSAAGSAVAYCVGITNIDPIKYNLLFERFLNPERKSMPDIDTDFDDEGRAKVLDYVIDKYGKNQVAQIINYGKMAAKSAMKDVARVLDYPLNDAMQLTKEFPDKVGSLHNAFKRPIDELAKDTELSLSPDELEAVKKFRGWEQATDLRAQVLKEAQTLEGSVRNTGIHASAVIIAPSDLLEHVPVSVNAKEGGESLVTQWDGHVIEQAGLLKMDFLGLRTLTILKNATELIEQNHGVKIDPDSIPLDDTKTFELFQRGDTTGIFQFESDGMKKYLRDLKPNRFEDLIAMNALYRPGPMDYIPSFIKRKHGLEQVTYPLPDMQEILEETYGITVYQEQVMLLSQKLAGFTKGDADTLRKAMGKKQRATLDKMKPQFIEGAMAKGHPKEVLEKTWTDWEAFAQYAFNKSHSTCYAFLANQTGYLKAHYPAEFMAATLNNSGNIEDIAFFMDECRRMGIPVLGPDINESYTGFAVNKKGEIRCGMGRLKGAGDLAVSQIIEERKTRGPFKSIFDLTRRVSLKNVNKRVLEALAYGGAFDSLEDTNRARYFATNGTDAENAIEKAIKFGGNQQATEAANQASLFGGSSGVQLAEPKLPVCEPWGILEQLSKEKEVVGMYITGHPLDKYKFELDTFCRNQMAELSNLEPLKAKELTLGGMVTRVQHRTGKNGNKYGQFSVEDYSGSYEFRLFTKDYINFNKYMIDGLFVYMKVLVSEYFGRPGELVVNIKFMTDLTGVRQEMLKHVSLKFNATSLTIDNAHSIVSILNEYKGITPVKFVVSDTANDWSVNAISSTYRIDFTQEVSARLKEMNVDVLVN